MNIGNSGLELKKRDSGMGSRFQISLNQEALYLREVRKELLKNVKKIPPTQRLQRTKLPPEVNHDVRDNSYP